MHGGRPPSSRPPGPAKIRIPVRIKQGETVVNQCAHASLHYGHNMVWVSAFLGKAEKCTDLDSLMRVVLSEFDIQFVEET